VLIATAHYDNIKTNFFYCLFFTYFYFSLLIITIISTLKYFSTLMKSSKQLKITLSPMVENMAVSKTIEIHSLTKDMEKAGKLCNNIFCSVIVLYYIMFYNDVMHVSSSTFSSSFSLILFLLPSHSYFSPSSSYLSIFRFLFLSIFFAQ
jgi:hypothetical protein